MTYQSGWRYNMHTALYAVLERIPREELAYMKCGKTKHIKAAARPVEAIFPQPKPAHSFFTKYEQKFKNSHRENDAILL